MHEYYNKAKNFKMALQAYWNEISHASTEGLDCLKIIAEELHHIEPFQLKDPLSDQDSIAIPSENLTMDESYAASELFNRALANIMPYIRWYPNNVYSDSKLAVESCNFCANLVGEARQCQHSPFLYKSDNILIGLFYLGPHHFYPEHLHPASEFWIILSGTAKWKRGDEPWTLRKAGESFIHTTNQSHAMETLDEPILAMWAWTGDLTKWAKWV